MSRTDFDNLVDELERRYAGRYRALAWRTALVVGIGYVGFLMWVLSIAAVGLAACLGALYAPPVLDAVLVVGGACVLAVALWQALEVLWLAGDENKPLVLRLGDAPLLFALMDRLHRGLRTPRIHRVELNTDMNASIQQRSRLGILGWQQNSLRLGMPLMDVLTLAEFESVLAHEYAHVSARHGRFGAWIYRTHGTWLQLFGRLQQPPKSSFSHSMRKLLGKFVDWYWPRFHAYFFVMSRAHEYKADRAAAEWAGPDTAARALWTLDLSSRRLEQRFWPELSREAAEMSEPPADLSGRIRDYLARPADVRDVELWSRQVLASVTDNSDTHPSLSDRIASFGGSRDACQAIGYPQPPAVSAAAALFKTRLDGIRNAVDQHWQRDVAEQWRARHHRTMSVQRRANELAQAPMRADGGVATLWERAYSILDLHGPEAAEPLLRELLSQRPSHAAANLALGRHLLGRGQADGAVFLHRVLDQPECELIPDACQVLAQHYQATGQAAELRKIHDHLGRYQRSQAEAIRERTSVTAGDRFLPHELSSAERELLCGVLSGDAELAEAYLVRKELQHLVHQRLYVLCVRTRPGFFGGSNSAKDAALVGRLIPRVRLPGRVLVISPQGGFRPLARKIMARPDARLYSAR
jgi:Zn-dependent protease with chaperone function